MGELQFLFAKTIQQARDTSKTNLGIRKKEKIIEDEKKKFNEVIYNKSGTVEMLRVWGAAK